MLLFWPSLDFFSGVGEALHLTRLGGFVDVHVLFLLLPFFYLLFLSLWWYVVILSWGFAHFGFFSLWDRHGFQSARKSTTFCYLFIPMYFTIIKSVITELASNWDSSNYFHSKFWRWYLDSMDTIPISWMFLVGWFVSLYVIQLQKTGPWVESFSPVAWCV